MTGTTGWGASARPAYSEYGGRVGQWTGPHGKGGQVSAGGSVEQLLRQVSPGHYGTYESLLDAIARDEVWMLLWSGRAGTPDAQYGNMEVNGYGYAPCVTSAAELAASGWDRAHEVVPGREIAEALWPERWGIWLNPHAPGGGVGIPWLDLRRIAAGLDQLPPGPLRIDEPALDAAQFYALLGQHAHRTPAVRSLRRCWVQPALGAGYLAIGLDLYDSSPQSLEAAAQMMEASVPALPEGLPVSRVSMADDYDPVAMWLRRNARPFFDRDLQAPQTAGAVAPTAGYGYPPRAY